MSKELIEKKLNFESSPLEDLLFKRECYDNPILAHAMTVNYTSPFFEDFQWRFGLNGTTNHKKNLILSIYGEPGTGKSNIMMFLSEFVTMNTHKDFSADDICFSRTELLNRIKLKLEYNDEKNITEDEKIELTRGCAFALDEQTRGNFGTGSMREEQELKSIVDIFRKLQTFNCFISPSLHSTNISHYYLRAIGIDYDYGYNKSILYKDTGFNLKPIGYVITGKADEKIWKEYSKKKDYFINLTVSSSNNAKEKSMIEKAQSIIELSAYSIAKAKQEKQNIISFKFPNLSIAEIEKIYYFTTLIERAKKQNISIEDALKISN